MDARGNLTNDGVYTYTYDTAGRMVQADSLTATLVYTYTSAALSASNGDGLLVTQGTSATVSTFTWDLALRLPQVLGTSDSRHLYGYGRIGVRQADAWHYPLPDALGSARQWADGIGSLAYAAGYTPFGVPMWQQGSAPVPWGYTGEYWDANVGLLYLRARWYDPTVGRFTQADRIVPNPLNSQAWNRYAYGLNNPLLYTDPSGYCADNQDDPVCKHVPLLITYSLYYEILSYEVRVGEPGRQPINEELAAKINTWQAGLDTIGWAINLNRLLADSAVFLLVISSPPSAPAVAPVAVLSKIADEYDACTGWLGALMSSSADYYEGYTYLIQYLRQK